MTSLVTERQGWIAPNIPLGILCGAGAGALWGLVFLAPELLRSFTPLQLATGRYLAYGAVAGVLIMPRWSILKDSLRRADWLALCWLSLSGNTLYYILLSMAVQNGGIALTSLVIGFLPVTVTMIGSRDHGAMPVSALLPSLLLCAVGAACIGWQAVAAPEADTCTLMGFLCALGALVSWTVYAVGNSRCLARLHTVSAHDWNLLLGLVTGVHAALLVPVALMIGHLHHSLAEWTRFASVSFAVAILASILGNALWNRMSRLVPLTLTGQMILFETLFALFYGFVWEARWPRPCEAAAFVLLVLSVLTSASAHRRQSAE